VDLSHRFIEFKGEAHQVDTLEIAMLLCQRSPRGVIDEVDFVPFVVTVAQPAYPAEKVTQVSQRHQRLSRLALLWGVMMSDHLHDIVGEMPFLRPRPTPFRNG
jgi:hypothetical protein